MYVRIDILIPGCVDVCRYIRFRLYVDVCRNIRFPSGVCIDVRVPGGMWMYVCIETQFPGGVWL